MDKMSTGASAIKGVGQHEASLKGRILSAVFWLGATKIIGQAITWTITIYVARILSPDDYGLMGMAGVFLGFISFFNEVGLGAAIIQKKDLKDEDISNVFWVVILLNTLLYIIAYFLSPVISAFFHEPRITSIIRIIAMNFIISGLGFISYNMLMREMRFKRRSLAEFIGNVSGGIVTLLLAVNGWGVWSLVYGGISLTAITNLFFYIYYPWKPDLSFYYFKIKDMINFGIKIATARFFWFIYTNSDSLMAGKLLGKTMLGYYSLAFQLASIPMDKIVSIVTQVAFPAFSEIQGDAELFKRYFLMIVRSVAFVTFPLFLGIFLVADDAVPLFLTEKWSAAVLPLKVLCIVSTLRAINAINVPLVVAKGRPNIAMLNNLIYAVVLPVAFYIGSFYGLAGFSYAWLYTFPVLFLITTYISLHTISLSMLEYFKELRHVFFATLFMAILVSVFREILWTDTNRIIRLNGMILTGAASYFFYYLMFNREIISEAKMIFKRK